MDTLVLAALTLAITGLMLWAALDDEVPPEGVILRTGVACRGSTQRFAQARAGGDTGRYLPEGAFVRPGSAPSGPQLSEESQAGSGGDLAQGALEPETSLRPQQLDL